MDSNQRSDYIVIFVSLISGLGTQNLKVLKHLSKNESKGPFELKTINKSPFGMLNSKIVDKYTQFEATDIYCYCNVNSIIIETNFSDNVTIYRMTGSTFEKTRLCVQTVK